MIYAIVIDYIDGHKETELINQRALTATKDNACIMGFTYTEKATRYKHLAFEYVSAIQKENRQHPIERTIFKVDLSSVTKVHIYSTDNINGNTVLSSLLSTPYTT